MNLFWTSKNPIKGFNHFVLVDKKVEMGKTMLVLVSVLEAEINIIISRDVLENSEQWESGCKEVNNGEGVLENYSDFKLKGKGERINKIFLSQDSPFYIS